MDKDSNLTCLKITGLICIMLMYICASLQGYDGYLLTTVVGIMAAIVGVEIGRYGKGKEETPE